MWSSWRWRVDSGGEEEVAACMYVLDNHTPHTTHDTSLHTHHGLAKNQPGCSSRLVAAADSLLLFFVRPRHCWSR